MDKLQPGNRRRIEFPINPEGDIQEELAKGAVRLVSEAIGFKDLSWFWKSCHVLIVSVPNGKQAELYVRRVAKHVGRLTVLPSSKSEQ